MYTPYPSNRVEQGLVATLQSDEDGCDQQRDGESLPGSDNLFARAAIVFSHWWSSAAADDFRGQQLSRLVTLAPRVQQVLDQFSELFTEKKLSVELLRSMSVLTSQVGLAQLRLTC